MEQYMIRKATLGDLNVLKNIEQEIIKAERPFDETLDKDPISYYDLRELMMADNARVLVAEDNGEIVGTGFGVIRDAKPFLNHEKYAYLGFMYTAEAYRGKGVNKVIVDALLAWAKTKGINEARLTVYSDNSPAIRAYEKSGFKNHIIEMRVGLD
ncbi:GNAT family N-acetyltransferase [Arenibacter latericius]|uniref:GNAT family N-acetyltransferase n=1 Tax=Arenibacter latericius TaxID=86104 RepID=UPI0003F94773|nr:GNAT family N-acetyltransferase [Arenibacter latericius]MDX1365145.1 GNAT family N-acetyltransferase [Arenibacter latericius]